MKQSRSMRGTVAGLSVLVLIAIAHPAAGQLRGGGTGAASAKRTGRTHDSDSEPPRHRPRSEPRRHGPDLLSGPRLVPPPADRIRPYWPHLAWGSIGFGYAPAWYVAPPVYEPAAIASPENAPLGGLQLDIEPRRAQVYVDGTMAGLVEDFSGYYKHLELGAGAHLIQVLASGYDPLVFDVMIVPGRTSTYRASLPRAPGR